MRNHVISLVNASFLIMLILCGLCFGAKKPAGTSTGKQTQATTLGSGYCCVNGKVTASTISICRSRSGLFYEKSKEATQACSKLLKPEQKAFSEVPIKGFCCNDGKVTAMSQKSCKKHEGLFGISKGQVQKACKEMDGYCCDNGEVTSSQRQQCGRIKGMFSEDRQKAVKKCASSKGYCCADGEVAATTKAGCDKKRGVFSTDRKQVDRECGKVRGYCCKGREIRSLSRFECEKSKGFFAISRQVAEQQCAALRGYCCTGAKLRPSTQGDCLRKKGEFFQDKRVADKSCVVQSSDQDILSVKRSVKTDVTTQLSGKKRITAGKSQHLNAQTMMKDTASMRPDPSSPPEMVPLRLDRGIDILNPVNLDRYFRGDTVIVLYRFSGSEPVSGEISLVIMNRAGIVAGSASVAIGSNPVYIPLREDAPVGTYVVTMSHASGAYGESDEFNVHHNTGRIDFYNPTRDNELHQGESVEISYQLNRRVQAGPIVFELYHNGEVYGTETIDYVPAPPSRSESRRTFTWVLPSGIPDSQRYVILARHSNASGFTNPFSIQAFRDMGGMAEPYDLRIIEISRENDSRGSVIARVSASAGFIADDVDIGVNVDGVDYPHITREHLPRGETEIVVGEMPTPVVTLGMDSLCMGDRYTVEIDPANEHGEINEDNNLESQQLFFWEEKTVATITDPEGNQLYNGSESRIPCSYSDYDYGSRSFSIKIKNCGASDDVPVDVVIRQSGRRSVPGTLGDESFDEVVTHRTFYDTSTACSARELGVSGRTGCAIIRVGLDSITHVDSRLTFSGGPFESPVNVDVNFGELSHWPTRCNY